MNLNLKKGRGIRIPLGVMLTKKTVVPVQKKMVIQKVKEGSRL
jgi:hypothetical protein